MGPSRSTTLSATYIGLMSMDLSVCYAHGYFGCRGTKKEVSRIRAGYTAEFMNRISAEAERLGVKIRFPVILSTDMEGDGKEVEEILRSSALDAKDTAKLNKVLDFFYSKKKDQFLLAWFASHNNPLNKKLLDLH